MLMGLEEEVARARAHVAKLTFDNDHDASFFETSIRCDVLLGHCCAVMRCADLLLDARVCADTWAACLARTSFRGTRSIFPR